MNDYFLNSPKIKENTMKKLLSVLALLLVCFTFNSCTEEEPCKGEITTYTLSDGTTRTIEQPCFE